AAYHDDAVELRILDVASGVTQAITTNGAVNVEPRWSPDGTRLAFVSTLYNQRFHIHTITIANGAPGEIERLTEDNDSGLPRYYYSRFDHYLSPTWSPDGSEILFISNGGHIWGSGGIFRMKARPGARGREIHDEETTWKARPDWSPDGHRVVYSSYLGRAWNQLWLMTDQGGDPFQLTYGDFDATAPRWSRDGGRIAYISNEGGNTSLFVIRLPGGARRRVAIRERHHLGPVGRLTVRLLDGTGGRVVPARVSVTGADDRHFGPDDAWRHADEAFVRSERRFEYGYFHSEGQSEMTLPAGVYAVEVMKGLEYRTVKRRVEVPAGGARTETFVLRRLDNLPARGWWCGDLHAHMNYGGSYRNDPRHLALQAGAEGLNVVESLIVNKEQRIPDMAYFSPRPDPVSTRNLLIMHGQEFHTSFWGHLGLLGLEDYLMPDYAGYVNTAAASLFPTNADVLDLAHSRGAIGGYVHPFDAAPDPTDADEPLTYELPVDVALGKVDYLEVMGFSDHLITSNIWYRLLNCGFRLPAGAGTDAFPNFASLRGPVGLLRVYVKAGPTLDHRHFLDGIRAGRTFATNAPLLTFTLAGKEAGDEIRLPAGRHRLEVRATLRSIVPMDHLEIIGSGGVVETLPLAGDRSAATWKGAIAIEKSGWYLLRAWSDRPTTPILDLYPFGTTSPIYVSVGDEPVRSASDAEFFLAWVDRLVKAAAAHEGYNTPGEKDSVLKTLSDARAVYAARAREAAPR
ncbi:MAG TPA: CehA/McbA family metallohydrolase, partial [Candidatus Polarisedimenticolia bacterium]|nr:CehA/McbA family metallohydrolase [Candidatus Polarisedimenticolia bacterium]